MKKIFLAMIILLAALGIWAQTSPASDWPVTAGVSSGPTATTTTETVTHPPVDTPAVVVFVPLAPVVAYPRLPYLLWPALSFGFGFGHPYVSGYYRSDYGHSDHHNHQ